MSSCVLVCTTDEHFVSSTFVWFATGRQCVVHNPQGSHCNIHLAISYTQYEHVSCYS